MKCSPVRYEIGRLDLSVTRTVGYEFDLGAAPSINRATLATLETGPWTTPIVGRRA